MEIRWQNFGRGLLVVSVVLLLASSGVALAHGDESTQTTVTTTTTNHDTETATQADDGHHGSGSSDSTETHQSTKDAHETASGHAHESGAEDTGAGHHESGEQSDGHSHGSEGDGLFSGWISIVGGLFLLGAITTAPTYRYVKSTGSTTIGPVHLVGALLALFTAAVHLYLFLHHGNVIMLLAGLGFVGGVVLLFTGIAQQYLYVGGIVYTLAQLLLWVNAEMPHLGSFGLLDKIAQVALIAVLGYLYVE